MISKTIGKKIGVHNIFRHTYVLFTLVISQSSQSTPGIAFENSAVLAANSAQLNVVSQRGSTHALARLRGMCLPRDWVKLGGVLFYRMLLSESMVIIILYVLIM